MVRNGHLIPNLSSEYNGEHGVLIVYVTIDNGERLLPGTLAWPGSAGALLTRHCNKTSGLERQYLHVDVEVKCTTSHCLETTYVIYNADIFVLKDIYIYPSNQTTFTKTETRSSCFECGSHDTFNR